MFFITIKENKEMISKKMCTLFIELTIGIIIIINSFDIINHDATLKVIVLEPAKAVYPM